MAENWIAVDHNTPQKPEVIGLAIELGISNRESLGLLVEVWIWADRNTYDGTATCNGVSVTFALLDAVFGVTGLAEALSHVGWLVEDEDGVATFPNFGDNNGKTAKTRKATNRRVAKHRKKPKPPVQPDCNAGTVTTALQTRYGSDGKALPQEQEQEQEQEQKTIYIPGEGIRIPSSVDTPEIQTAVGRWFAHINADDTHKSIPPNSPQEEATWRLVASWGTPGPETVAAIDAAIAGQWSNLRKPEAPKQARGNGKPKSPSIMDTLDDMIEEESRNEQF